MSVSDDRRSRALNRRQLVLGGTAVGAGMLASCSTPFVGGLTPGGFFLGSGAVKRIEGAAPARDSLTISPDGNLLAFAAMTRNGASKAELFVYDREAKSCIRYNLKEDDQPEDRRYYLAKPAFSSDGKSLAVSARRAKPNPQFVRESFPTGMEFADIAVFDLAGGRARRFGDRRYFYSSPTFSLSGKMLACTRTRDLMRWGAHVEGEDSYYHRFVEFDLRDGVERPFASVDFGMSERSRYDPDGESLLVWSQPPLPAHESRSFPISHEAPETWRIRRGMRLEDVGAPEIARNVAGPQLDQLCGVDRVGDLYICVRRTEDARTPAPYEFFRISDGQTESLFVLQDEDCDSPCVSLDRPAFAWLTNFDVSPGVIGKAIRVVDGDRSELIDLTLALSDLTDRIIST